MRSISDGEILFFGKAAEAQAIHYIFLGAQT
jgi:hypothetical protein